MIFYGYFMEISISMMPIFIQMYWISVGVEQMLILYCNFHPQLGDYANSMKRRAAKQLQEVLLLFYSKLKIFSLGGCG